MFGFWCQIIHTLLISYFNIIMPPLKKGAYCFASVGRYVGWSVCRPNVVCSMSFDPFTWSITNLMQGLPSMSRWSLVILRSHSKFKVKPLFSAQCVVRSTFTWSIPNLVQGLHPISRWFLLILRSHVQRSRSNHSSQPTVLFALYI